MKKHLIYISILLSISLNSFSTPTTEAELIIDSIYELSQLNYYTNPDSAVKMLSKCIEFTKNNHDTLQIIRLLHELTTLYLHNLKYYSAYQATWEALRLSENSKDSINLGTTYELLSKLFSTFSQRQHATDYINKSISINKVLIKKEKIDAQALVTNYFNAAIICRYFEDYKTALIYIDSCLVASNDIEQDTIHKSYIYCEKAYHLIMTGNYQGVESVLLNAKNIFEKLPRDDPDNKTHTDYLVFIYTYLGDYYAANNNLVLSKKYYYQSLDYIETENAHKGMTHYVLYQLSLLLHREGNMSEAFDAMHSSKLLFDTVYGIRSNQNIRIIELKNNYEEEIENKDRELYENALHIADQERVLLKIKILLFILISIIIIGILIVRNRNQKIKYKHEKETNSRENKLKEQAAQNLLEVKNKELTTFTLQFIEKDKTINTLIDLINSNKDKKDIKTYLKTIQVNNDLWDEFNHRFNSVNSGFYERLSKQFPNLSATEKKHCALIKLNFSGKEMGHLLGITLESVHISRHRLRKKMGLDRDTNLSSFIAKI